MPRLNVYAGYRGDEFIGIGTKYELAELLGILPETLKHYASKACERKREQMQETPNRVYVFKLDDDDQGDE